MSFFLTPAPASPALQRLLDEDVAQMGFEMNGTHLWAYQPETLASLFELLGATKRAGDLSMRELGILVTATASTLGDSYCSLAWGMKFSEMAGVDTAAGVLSGDDSELTEAEAIMADWARSVVRDPNGTTQADVDRLREAGFGDAQIFAVTTFVALRLAFSTVNDALGARPDADLREIVPNAVQEVVTWGRAVEGDAAP